jgi:hydroxypyruvate reductase
LKVNIKKDALAIFREMLRAASAGDAVRAHWKPALKGLRMGDFERVVVVSVGKAAAAMAKAAEQLLGRDWGDAIVLTKHGHAAGAPRHCRLFEAAHPVPDETGVRASAEVESLLRTLHARDLLIVALSGGASALMSAPAAGISLADKQRTTGLLLRAGANIQQLNTVRKHLSKLKGGRLAALAYPATVVALILSDVIGDPLDVIASGPTAPDPTTFADALRVLREFHILERVPRRVRAHLESGERGEIPETPKPQDPVLENVRNVIVGSNSLALAAGAKKARALGYRTLILSSVLDGEARELGRTHAAILRELAARDQPLKRPACVLSGGEPTVTVRGDGLGGRAQELALAAGVALDGVPNVALLSAGTDGTDGPTDAAGALVTGETLARGRRAGLDPADFLSRNDAYRFLEATGDLLKTGATGTNVMDVNILLAGKS